MKNKGFVLMETIVVIVVISVALVTIFSSYNKILRKVKEENKYDTSEYVYMTKYIKDFMKLKNIGKNSALDIYPCTVSAGVTSCSDITNVTNYKNNIQGYDSTIDRFNVKAVYILKNINNFNKNVNSIKNSLYFDAYMIDYIRQMDVMDSDEVLIIEYGRQAVDRYGNEIIPTQCPDSKKNVTTGKCLPLYETYIASLEW